MGGKSSAPPPPDYAAAAQQTAAGNKEAASYAVNANRADQYTPYGSLTWNKGTRADGTEQWTQNVNLSDTGQKLFDQQNKTSLGMAGLQDQAMGRVAQAQNAGWNDAALSKAGTALDPSTLSKGPALDPSKLQMGTPFSFGGGGTAPQSGGGQSAPQSSGGGGGGVSINVNTPQSGGPVSWYDASKVGGVGKTYDASQDTSAAQNAILDRINPQLDRRRAALENQLANQGITRGSEAWKSAQSDLGQQENDAYSQASLQGIDLGMKQQGQTYQQAMANRSALSNDQNILAQQQLSSRGQDIQSAGVGVQAAGIAANQATAMAQMGMQERLANQNFGLQAQGQGFNQTMANNQLYLQAQNQGFGQNLQGNQQTLAAQNQGFNQSNALRGAGLQEQGYFANRDINQLNALRTGSQVNNPTFGSYAQQQTTQGPDMLNAANMGYQAQLAQNNANNANSAGMFGGAMSIAGAAAPYMFSDERLKEDIERVGTLPSGIGIYLWRYIGDSVRQLGLIAQDVQKIMPDAVKIMENGYLAVNYQEVLK